MKIVVYPHSMEIGGSQLNAVEIAAAVGRLGHEVLLVAEPGPMMDTADRLGLESHLIPEFRRRPSLPVARTLVELVRKRGVDIVHGYEWPPVLDSWLGPTRRLGTPVTATVMSAAVAPFVPRSLSLVVGTDELRRRCVGDGFERVTLLEPPVDVDSNHPGFPGGEFRASLGVGGDTVLIVVVCRLARELKLEGLLTACRTVGELVRQGQDVRLAIVGDGPVRDLVEVAADRANARAGQRAVHMVGQLDDPRPAYAGADIMLGMGGSALRGMAFGKPLVVQGERGFWCLCDEDSVHQFLDGGWYGLGEPGAGDGDAERRLRAELGSLLADPARRSRLGEFSRALVVERFSLDHAARIQLDVYTEAMSRQGRPSVTELARTLSMLGPYKVGRRIDRYRGRANADDFNAVSRMAT